MIEGTRTYVGMDVHARSITCAALDVETGEAWRRRFDGEAPEAQVAEWALGLPQPAYLAYESGCCAYGPARAIRGAGLACDVIAVSTLPRSQKGKSGKNDRRDAASILSAIANPFPEHTVVWVPDEGAEGVLDLVHAHAAAVADAKAAKQRVQSLLLKYGIVWRERTRTGRVKKRWGADFRKWVKSAELPTPAARLALEAHLAEVELREARADELAGRLQAASLEPRWKPYVDALTLIKGVGVITALHAAARICDFTRFGSGRRVSAWLGTVPREASSGEKEARGRITRQGNALLRSQLVEGACRYGAATSAPKRPRPGAEVPPAVAAAAQRCNERLRARHARLTGDLGKNPCAARVALASELIRWIWAIGLEVQLGLGREG